tara:strand:- start:281 stop:1153 length:873 start_codon:yes stop_codon:yes gene_type:complete
MKKMKQKNTILGIEKYPSHNAQPYKCEYCDYITSDASNFSKHLKTPKHQMKQMKTMVVLNEKNKVFQCKYCNKILKSRTTLWRHEKKCNGCEENDTIKEIKKELEKLKMENAILKGENNILKDNSVPQTITNNNTFNVQLFLNEECKNAMNMGDFIKTIKLSLDDLDYSLKNGKMESVANIFIKELKGLDKIERPIHCTKSDTSNVLYIKENNIWEEDADNKILEASIDNIETNHYKLLEQWEEANPEWMKDQKLTDIYLDMVKKSMSKLTEKEKLVIINNISNLTRLDK